MLPTSNRFLHVVLYMAERAWSHAMEKRQLPDGPNGRQRIYLLGRLRKAVKWATLFAQLCAVRGDSRTSLEAEVHGLLVLIFYFGLKTELTTGFNISVLINTHSSVLFFQMLSAMIRVCTIHLTE